MGEVAVEKEAKDENTNYTRRNSMYPYIACNVWCACIICYVE